MNYYLHFLPDLQPELDFAGLLPHGLEPDLDVRLQAIISIPPYPSTITFPLRVILVPFLMYFNIHQAESP